MFKRKTKIDSFTNLIAEGTIVTGEIDFTGVICIRGRLSGKYLNGSAVEGAKGPSTGISVADTGFVESEAMRAELVSIDGTVHSKRITADTNLRIGKTAKITGALIQYRTIEIENGAVLINCQLEHIDHISITTSD